jgi:hypothetical protein
MLDKESERAGESKQVERKPWSEPILKVLQVRETRSGGLHSVMETSIHNLLS